MRALFAFLSGCFLVALCLSAGSYYILSEYQKPAAFSEEKIVFIKPGSGLSKISEKLEEQNIISDRRIFKIAAFLSGESLKIKAGEYAVPPKSSAQDVLNILVSGKTLLHKFTVAEGAVAYDIVQRIISDGRLSGELTETVSEGEIKPETYLFSRGFSKNKLLRLMKKEQFETISRFWESRAADLPIKNMSEALILASIVEKETGRDGERAKVASVFTNRLRKNMRLQSDPTIIYGVTGGKGALNRPIYRTDILRKTDYNTYQIDGLPVGPICNPGEAALRAVLNPAKTEYLYFVANGKGGHNFAKTLAAHNQNVKIWRMIEKKNSSK